MSHSKKIFIGFDKDGTLDSFTSEVPNELISLCHELKKTKDIEFFLSTGRNIAELTPILTKFNGLFSYISTENSGIIFNELTQKKIYTGELNARHELDSLVKSILEKFGNLITKDREKETIWSAEFEENLNLVYKYCKEFISKNNLSITAYPHGNYNGTIDLVPHSINKVNIVNLLPENSQIYFFGDSENDFELLNHEKVIPGTVQNAVPRILELVNKRMGFVAQEKCGLGVLSGLKHFFLP